MESVRRYFKYIVAAIIGVVLTIFICWLKDFSLDMDRQYMYKVLADATLLPAVTLIGFGLLVSLSNFGLFLSVGYSLKRFMTIFSKEAAKQRENMEIYYEYRQARLNKNVSGAFLYLVGLVFFLVSIAFTFLFY